MSRPFGSMPKSLFGFLNQWPAFRQELIGSRGTRFKRVLIPFTLILAACQPDAGRPVGSDKNALQSRSPRSPFKNPVALSDPEPRTARLQPPESGEVLRAIYRREGNGSASYEIENGAWASFWYGYAYEKDGRQYFTGFAYSTPPRDMEETSPGPGDQVSISQATYIKAPEGSVAVWEFVKAERGIGRFGGHERGNAVDELAVAQTHVMPDGDRLLAVPTWYMESGTEVRTAEIFRLGEEHRWQYLGSVAIGENNSAGCAENPEEGLPPCAVSLGKLTFLQRPGDAMPSILVAKRGKVVEAAGKTRELGPLDDREYFYQGATGRYQ